MYADVRFIPSSPRVTMLEVLRHYADLLVETCGLEESEERDSLHYVEATYFTWERSSFSVNLSWCDEADAEEWLCLSIISYQRDAYAFAYDICTRLEPYIHEWTIV